MTSNAITAGIRRITCNAAAGAQAFRLGAWRVDPGLGRISMENAERVVEPKVMEVLVHLAARRGELVSTDELITTVWRGRPMGDNPVHRCVSILRRTLGDDAHSPRYIGTIPKRGYRVVASVEPVRGEAVPRAPEGVARNAGEVLECILRIGGRELHIAAVIADGLPSDWEGLRLPEIGHLVSVVRNIARDGTR
jgi:DNA-binding winged helix-turn-helix (wHTH) protein